MKMINSQHLRERLGRRPFRPFRLHLSDGSRHDVPHPEFAWVYGGRVFVGEEGSAPGVEDGALSELAILHLTRIEDLPARRRPTRPRRRGRLGSG